MKTSPIFFERLTVKWYDGKSYNEVFFDGYFYSEDNMMVIKLCDNEVKMIPVERLYSVSYKGSKHEELS